MGRDAVAWTGDWERGAFVHLIDVGSGREVLRETCAATELHPAGSGFVVLDTGWRLDGGRATPRLVGLGPEVVAREVEEKTLLVGVDPQGGRLVVFREGRIRLVTWPDLEEVASWDGYSSGVDWRSGCIWWRHSSDDPFVVAALDGSWERPLPESQRVFHLVSVGGGAVRLGHHGIRVLRPPAPVLEVLLPTSRSIWHVHVSDDGNRVDALLGGKPRSFEVDLTAAQVLAAPGDAAHLARAHPRLSPKPAWHPTAGLVATRRPRRTTAVTSVVGDVVCRLPAESWPLAWVGTSLLTTRFTGARGELELWRIP